MGFDILLVGRCYANSPSITPRAYHTKRMRLLFKKGFKFYAEYNLRLFFFLLFRKCDILIANDLDTLLPNFLISKLKKKSLVYDSHEYFCGLPELIGRPIVQYIWKRIEQFCVPKVPNMITVCQSIADIYDKEYPERAHKVTVIRNFPKRSTPHCTATRADLGLPEHTSLIVMQGAINKDRGAEELILAMHEIDNACLLIIGDGDIILALKNLVRTQHLENKVRFIPRINPERLFAYTQLCDIGCSLEKDTNLNYRYCLPNKLFDYLKAGLPVVVSNLPEMAQIVHHSHIGEVLSAHSPHNIALSINKLLNDKNYWQQCHENALKASLLYCWENEEHLLHQLYQTL